MTNREKLRDLMDRLDEAPIELDWLRDRLEGSAHLPEAEAAQALKYALNRLAQVQWALTASPVRSQTEALAQQAAIDWIATARAELVDYSVN